MPIGTNLPGVVVEVPARALLGKKIEAGTILFRIDETPYRAELKVRQAALDAAEADLHRLENAPRPEDLPIAEAAVEENAPMAQQRRGRPQPRQATFQRSAGTQTDFDTAWLPAPGRQAALAKSSAELLKLKRGTWKEEIDIARAKVEQARAQLSSTESDIERLKVRALVPGTVLQVNVRPGQYAAMIWKEPLVVLGNDEVLHVRVDIDEHDLPRFRPGARAVGFLRGFSDRRFDLEFVRVEPYVIPKKSLTGDNSERVDTRVLEVIYRLPSDRPIPVYVGQQMDAYLEAGPARTSEAAPAHP
ncbi:MAG: HlyD family efflux transporter periplasmic adaptor subunit [Isosphaeraceae bacterium]